MNKLLADLKITRLAILNSLAELSTEQLNQVPAGFNNNVIWNLGHMIAAQQGLFYLRAGFEMTVAQHYYDHYKTGSKPESFVSEQEIAELKQVLISSIDAFDADWTAGKFNNSPIFKNRYGVEINNREETLNFVVFHDGLHFGYIMAMKRLVAQ